MNNITASIVIYNNSVEEINNLINSCNFIKWIIIDNSKKSSNFNTEFYVHCPDNPGFGSAHNKAFEIALKLNSKFHFIINPDIIFDNSIINKMVSLMNLDKEIALIMPKIVYSNNKIQRLAKLIPNPAYYFLKRFVPFNFLKSQIINKIELSNYNYDRTIEAPFLSGCFLLVNLDVISKFKGFDENIFLYFEDNDLCRNTLKLGYKNIVFPEVSVIHNHVKKSFLNLNNLKIYFKSGIYYFYKWGWFIDKERKYLNKRILSQFDS